jgi:protein-tyrosine phosphatase
MIPNIIEIEKNGIRPIEYTEKDSSNVVVVHCKGGKGRTGTCIATWMLATNFLNTADDALRHFGERRTDDTKGDAFQGTFLNQRVLTNK